MESLDLNLILALDALLEENSVTAAAARLHTSAPAMSRSLGRLRRALDDPILVRAGRNLVPTPRALELRGEVRAVVSRAQGLFAPAAEVDPAALTRTFNVQTSDAVVATLTARLIADVRAHAPGITLRFLPESLEDTAVLRDGRVDLEIGVLGPGWPELRTEALFDDRIVAAVRPGHPLARGRMTAARFAAAEHVVVSRRGRTRGPIDDRLDELGLHRPVVAVVPSYAASLFLARDSDLVCLTPAGLGRGATAALGLHTFEIPLELPPLRLGMAWHPRNDADRGHRWLRERVRHVFPD